MIKFDFETFIGNNVREKINSYMDSKKQIIGFLEQGDMRGWYNTAELFNSDLISDIKNTADYIRKNCDVFLVIGVGGSYMGSSAFIEALSPYFYNNLKKPEIYFVGYNLSSDYYSDLLKVIENKDVIVNVISKSGSTLEIDIAYNLVIDFMKSKYSYEEIKKRIIMTTDQHKGILREEVNKHGFKSFVVPDNIGGRYSVFTPVGLLPIAVSGIDIDEIIKGVKKAKENIDDAIYYVSLRNELYNRGKLIESYVVYEPKLYCFLEWIKQLYGESLGKNNRGIFPSSFINTRDLHSLGQFVQEGRKILFETVIKIKNIENDIYVEKYEKNLNEINNIVADSVAEAHFSGDVPSIVIDVDKLTPFTLGYLMQFFMISCAVSGFVENVNPFDQDGVEEYKKRAKTKLNK